MAQESGPPGLLMLHLLGRCNLQCAHCYMEGSPARQEQLPLDSVLQAIGECGQLGVGTLVLTGGEPLMYKALDRVLQSAAQVKSLQITLCTNGTLIAQHHLALFREVGLRASISVDGSPEFHDQFRNLAGAFRATERAVHLLVEAGIPVTVISTISQANLELLPATVGWAANAGVSQFLVQPLLKLGRGAEISSQCLTIAQMNRLILQLSDLANRRPIQGMSCQVIGAKRKFLLSHPCGAFVCNGTGCHRAVAKEIKKLVVREDGTVLPEVPNLNHRFAVGNLQDGPLSALVTRYFESGYGEFDRLCRAAYVDVLPRWECVIVPWEQIIAERSHTWVPGLEQPAIPHCGEACSTTGDLTCQAEYGERYGNC